MRGRASASHTGVRRFDSRGGDCLLLFADYNLRSIYKAMKSKVVRNSLLLGGASKSLLVYTLHSLEKTIARPYSIDG